MFESQMKKVKAGKRTRSSKSVSRAREKPKALAPETGVPNGSFPVVAIGASAGGLEAYTDFFRVLRPITGMSFVLVQHLDPSHHSMLTEIISKATSMPVEEVKSGTKLNPNRVYVIPHNALIAVSNGMFVLTPRSKGSRQHLAVNFFMRSVAEERKSKAIGIIFSGTGSDGTQGLEYIKAEGGITFAQDPITAKYDGMPQSAIASGCVDFILPPRDIAKELHRIIAHPYVKEAPEQAQEEEPEPKAIASAPERNPDYDQIIAQLRKSSGVDFSQYKTNTIYRRSMRRMVVLKLDSLEEYVKHLMGHPEEAEILFDDVLIPVTSFFRDLETFEALKSQVYPAIIQNKGNKGAIRMWAPGCSTGEETYSLAMTLLEFLGDRAATFQVQIFGTDLNEKGIQKARAGIYPANIAEEISPERMQRFFVKMDEGYRVNKAVRDMCVFARQNLAGDPPFSQMNLVACRNLLIYAQPVLQKKIVPILHYALKPSGFLVLGRSESIATFSDLFTVVDKKHKIYAKKAVASRLHYDFVQSYYPKGSGVEAGEKLQSAQPPELDLQEEADRVVLKHHAPVGVVINDAMEVVQFRGRTAPYLEPPSGKPSLNILKLARNGLAIELRALIAAARKKGVAVKKNGVALALNGHKRFLNLSVEPLGNRTSSGLKDDRYLLVLFEDATSDTRSSPDGSPVRKKERNEKAREFARLKQVLERTEEALRAAVETEDSLREEFQATNEEILSANEELQSTNEELETSKEELQSANEELSTLNDELRHKNAELYELGNDISNLLNSTRLPVVMLDRRLRIRRITPYADILLKIAPSDIGRSIADIRLNIRVDDLEGMIARVLNTLQPVQRDVLDMQNRWHSLHILPYRTVDDQIDGVVLILQDIDAIKVASEQTKKAGELFYSIINTVRQPLLVLDSDLRVMTVNQSFLQAFKVSREETVNKFLYRLGNEQWNIPRLRAVLEEVLPKDQAVTNFEVEHTFGHIGRRKMVLNARRLAQMTGREPMILLALEDVTERKQAEAALIKSEKIAASGRVAAVLAHEINNPLQAVTNLMSLLGQSQQLDPQDREYATLASKEMSRVVRLVQQSLGFYRAAASPAKVNVEEVLESVLFLYEKKIKAKQVELTKQYRFQGTLQSYPADMRQVFSTLLVNAMEACTKGCQIVLRTSKSRDWRDGARVEGVRITLADSGAGIRAEHAARLFEPFFTTKGEKGTGLGLWVARGIIDRLSGSIHLRSRTTPGNSGTCFSIFFPDQKPD
jgi:two-component system CheB/CheR fusion protein